MTTLPSVVQHSQAGKLNALAVTGKKRHPGMLQVTTMVEAGYPNIDMEAWVALYAPAGTPVAAINQLADAFRRCRTGPRASSGLTKRALKCAYDPDSGHDTANKPLALPYFDPAHAPCGQAKWGRWACSCCPINKRVHRTRSRLKLAKKNLIG